MDEIKKMNIITNTMRRPQKGEVKPALMTIDVIIEKKPPKKEVLDYFEKMIEKMDED